MWPEAGEDALEVLKVFTGDDGVEPRPGVLENISVISLSLCKYLVYFNHFNHVFRHMSVCSIIIFRQIKGVKPVKPTYSNGKPAFF